MKNNNYICHVPYLRNSIAYDHYFLYNCVKWCYLQGLFKFFWNFHFFVLRISGTVPHMIMVFGTHVWNDNVSSNFCLFFQDCDFLGFSKFIKKCPKGNYDVCPPFFTCVWFFLHFSFFKKKEFIWNAMKYFELM